jgi:polysaccharide export outer membrane protein
LRSFVREQLLERVHLLGLVLIALTPSCRTYHQEVWGESSTTPPMDAVYQLREGDVIEFTLPQDPSQNGVSTVRSDGIASLPLVGEIQLGGLSLSQARAIIIEALTGTFESPELGLSLKTTRDREIYIAGEVKTPGSIAYQDELTVLDALLRSGGPIKESADTGNIILVRTQADGERLAWRMDLENIWTSATPPRAINLLPGDVVLVPNTAIDRANIAIEKYITRMIPGGAIIQRLVLVGSGN